MAVSRRRLLGSLALTLGSGSTVEAAAPALGLDALRNASVILGANLADDRLRVIRPVLEQRLSELRVLRDLPIADAVAPTQGILD